MLTTFSKIFQKYIYLWLYKHICSNNKLAKEQNGFRINSSTEAQSYDVINEILQAMNNRLSEGGIYCNLGKAFDCVNHGIGVAVLQSYGIKGKFLALIQSYLTTKHQYYLLINIICMMEFFWMEKNCNWS